MEKILNSPIIKKIMNKSKGNLFIVIGLVGVILIAFSEFEKPVQKQELVDDTLETYRLDIQNNLTNILSSVYGAGEVVVMVTLEASWENVYVKEEKTQGDLLVSSKDTDNQQTSKNSYQDTIVIVEQDGEKTALIEKTIEPVIQGVIVTSSGADDISVVSDITNAVSIALNLPTNRICVIKKQ